MSWQSYVDTNLVGSGKVSKGAIIGIQGGVWAATPGYTISTEEQNAIIAGFTSPDTIQASGIHLAGQKFFTLRVTDTSIYGKKQADGVVAAKTKGAILIGEYASPVQAVEAALIVQGLADYLISQGI